MEEIVKDLEAAFKATAISTVTGDAVDALALVRAKLLKVYSELEKIEGENMLKETGSQEE